MHRIIGKPTIHPLLFWSGKIAGYVVWLLFFVQLKHNLHQLNTSALFSYAGYFFFSMGFILACISLIHLGNSVAAGIPTHSTQLKHSGIYKISRNPMYAGFHFMCIGSVLFTLNFYVLLLSLFSFYMYHKIILGEEAFLQQRFGESYKNYCQKVRRYL